MAKEPLPISVVYRRVQRAITEEFSGAVLVIGEVRKLRMNRGNCYFELVEPGGGGGRNDAVLNVVCWSSTLARVSERLSKFGVALEDGVQVIAGGALKTWSGGGRIQFELQFIDIDAMVGRLAAGRAEAMAALERDGLLRANARHAIALVPLRIGLVASRDSEGWRDFLGVIERSAYAFDVRWCHATVQGRNAPREIEAAIGAVGDATDLIVVVRGGGAAADLVAFDDIRVARAIATARGPIWVGVGHTGDQSLADEVAHTSFPTPTAVAQAIVDRVGAFDLAVRAQLGRASVLAQRSCDRAGVDLQRRTHYLPRAATNALSGVEHRNAHRVDALTRSATIAIERARARVQSRAIAIEQGARRVVTTQSATLATRRAQVRVLDPRGTLERGYAVARADDGIALRDATQVRVGDAITVSLARGSLRATVDTIEAYPTDSPPGVDR